MKRPLDVVTFDTDVHGPGPKRQASLSITHARTRLGAAGQIHTMEIEHDTVCDCVRMSLDTEDRPVVEIPWSRVRYCEPSKGNADEHPVQDAPDAPRKPRTYTRRAGAKKPGRPTGQRHQDTGHDPGSPEVA